ncbi:hypothetical protein BDZ97DRAFT_1840374 [Flammula alnicola]|nr:hypothetical protein BDZ97DRAFT_1840374 [Flammula alnicola]
MSQSDVLQLLKNLDNSNSGMTGTEHPTAIVDPLFKDPNADVIFCSGDGTHFHLQRKYLEANAGAFPGSEFDTRGEVVHLTESSDVLRILFGFVHPREHPDVEDLDFKTLAAVAEAAEKYEVFFAMNICKMQMRQFIPKNAVEILAHATRHDHPNLIQDVAPHLVRLPMMDVVGQLPPRYIVPWVSTSRFIPLCGRNSTFFGRSLNIGARGMQCSTMRQKVFSISESLCQANDPRTSLHLWRVKRVTPAKLLCLPRFRSSKN